MEDKRAITALLEKAGAKALSFRERGAARYSAEAERKRSMSLQHWVFVLKEEGD
jgi:hypothetical protein